MDAPATATPAPAATQAPSVEPVEAADPALDRLRVALAALPEAEAVELAQAVERLATLPRGRRQALLTLAGV